jgi:hypothetical protein
LAPLPDTPGAAFAVRDGAGDRLAMLIVGVPVDGVCGCEVAGGVVRGDPLGS